MPAIKNIIFDLGNVLLNLNFDRFNGFLHPLVGKSFRELYAQPQIQTIFDEFEVGRISEATFFQQLQETVFPSTSKEELKAGWNSLLGDIPKTRLDLLSSLRSEYPIYLLSNTNSTHIDCIGLYLEEAHGQSLKDFESLFIKAYYSFDIHERKPDAAIYSSVLKDANLTASETIFIDDNASNVESAKQLGIQAILHDPNEDITTKIHDYLSMASM